MAISSATSLAAEVSNTLDAASVQQLDTCNCVYVEFQLKTICYNLAAFNASSENTEDIEPARRCDNNDYCDDGSYSGTEAHWPNESDCATLGDWKSR